MSMLTRHLNGSQENVQMYSRRMDLPMLGEVALPPPDKVIYYAGIGVLAALQVIEWPIARGGHRRSPAGRPAFFRTGARGREGAAGRLTRAGSPAIDMNPG